MTVAACPRSLLHLQFLVANGAVPDVVLFRDANLGEAIERSYPGKARALGREVVPRGGLGQLLAARRSNRVYYQGVAETVRSLGIERLIIFLEGEPLERFLCSLPGIVSVELWEDGLSHYVNLTSDAWYAARGVVQALCGFYPKKITRRRMDRSRVLVRDRFEQGNLVLPRPWPPKARRDEFLLIGSPLIEDRILSLAAFRRALAEIAEASPWPVRYLAHPRERRERVELDAHAAGMIFDPNPGGLMKHAATYGYRAYGAAISTGLLDLGFHDRSCFLSGLFGLGGMARVLTAWSANPVPVVSSAAALRDRMSALAAALPDGASSAGLAGDDVRVGG
ncbi:MAG TPA: hypothetical protein VJM34_07180 [Novosphingobium sp.]|nr:hypothetical protein [Novosphingobium sp.]